MKQNIRFIRAFLAGLTILILLSGCPQATDGGVNTGNDNGGPPLGTSVGGTNPFYPALTGLTTSVPVVIVEKPASGDPVTINLNDYLIVEPAGAKLGAVAWTDSGSLPTGIARSDNQVNIGDSVSAGTIVPFTYTAAVGNGSVYIAIPNEASFFTAEDVAGGVSLKPNSSASEIIVPAEHAGKKVVAVHDFSSATTVSTVVLPETVTRIADNTFNAHSSLPEIFGPNVTEIGDTAFKKNSIYPPLTIPPTPSPLIGDYFYLPRVEVIGDAAFENIIFSGTFPWESVTRIGDSAFAQSTFTEISIPNVVYVGDFAFKASTLTEISIPKAVEVGEDAFLGSDTTLEKITVGGSLSIIVGNATDRILKFATAYEGISSRRGTYEYKNDAFRLVF